MPWIKNQKMFFSFVHNAVMLPRFLRHLLTFYYQVNVKIMQAKIHKPFLNYVFLHLPAWWPSCLDRGALINVDAPGYGTSVVRGPTGHK